MFIGYVALHGQVLLEFIVVNIVILGEGVLVLVDELVAFLEVRLYGLVEGGFLYVDDEFLDEVSLSVDEHSREHA